MSDPIFTDKAVKLAHIRRMRYLAARGLLTPEATRVWLNVQFASELEATQAQQHEDSAP